MGKFEKDPKDDRIRELEIQNEELQGRSLDQIREINEWKRKFIPLEAKVEDLSAQLQEADEERNQLSAQIRQNTNEINALTASNAAHLVTIGQLQNRIAGLTGQPVPNLNQQGRELSYTHINCSIVHSYDA